MKKTSRSFLSTVLSLASVTTMPWSNACALARSVESDRVSFGSARTYPPSVSLEKQVSNREQKYGACHIYAATAAVRAACFRRTGAVLPISEGFFFYRHLRQAVENPRSESFLTIQFSGLFSENNAGAFSTTLERVRRGEMYLDSDFSMSDLDRSLERARATRREFWALAPETRSVARATFETRMRRELLKDMDAAFELMIRAPKSDTSSATALRACDSSTLKNRSVTLTTERVVRLINAGFPVICQFNDRPAPSASSHVYVLIGYRYNAAFPGRLEVWARNSAAPDLVQTGQPLNCYAASVVYAPEEEARLSDALAF